MWRLFDILMTLPLDKDKIRTFKPVAKVLAERFHRPGKTGQMLNSLVFDAMDVSVKGGQPQPALLGDI